jgi:hypothetical protein
VSSLFCRHNRFTADCSICSKGTVLDADRATGRRSRPKPRGGASPGSSRRAATQFSGPYVSAGPYEREDGGRYEVRLERVPGGLRLAEWAGGRLERRAPELPAADVGALVAAASERELLPPRDLDALAGALREAPAAAATPATDRGDAAAASPGRSGDMREELRVEPRSGGRIRVGRWLHYPSRGWELQDAPPMLPAQRYAEALRAAARLGLVGAEALPAPG